MTKEEYVEIAKSVESTNYEINRSPIKINEVLKGYVVEVGCQTLALTDVNDVSTVVSYYLENKQECHRSYIDNTLTELVNKVLGK